MFRLGESHLILILAAAGAVLCSVVVFWLLRGQWRIGFLALASFGCVFYLSPLNASALLAWSLLFYLLSPLAARPLRGAVREGGVSKGVGVAAAGGIASSTITPGQRRWIIWLLVSGILTYLVCFKYVVPSLHKPDKGTPATLVVPYLMPLGISYFTFKFIHYAIEVARRNITDRSLPQFLCYVFWFPTFTAGPIERFDHFLKHQRSRWSADLLVHGSTRMAQGLIKKCVLADMLLGDTFRYASSPHLMRNLSVTPTWGLWGLGVVAYLYVYWDFAGYCDLAIGASQLFGLGIMENFDWPILATNIGTFWKRWHMTLTGWCQSYIYMPVLGLTRRPNLATYAAFVVIGLWHAASWPWLFWGISRGTGIMIYGAWARAKRKRNPPAVAGSVKPGLRFGTMVGGLAGVVATTLFISFGELITFGGLESGRDTLPVAAKLLFVTLE